MDKQDYRAVIRFHYLRGLNPSAIAIEMLTANGYDAPSLRTIQRCYNEFRGGRIHHQDDYRSGRPQSSTTLEQINAVEQMVLADRRARVEYIDYTLGISHGCYSNFARSSSF